MNAADPVTRLNNSLEGRYRIESELGVGGMATVYLADDLKHERKVALKVLKPELAAVVGAERFLAEIKTTANLQHPNILPLFDSGEADSFLFYVMPYVEGEALRNTLDRDHQLPIDDAVQIAQDVAEALDYAHSRGVIHRDIKPANILLQAGKPMISDFGIALAVSAGGAGRLTETGLSLGTPHYMSPEQATGDQAVGVGSDIYALGCVLYEMLVGDPPYTGSTAQAILGKIIQAKPVSATAERRSVPANVDAAIRKALEKLSADRFTSVRDFGAALTDPAFRHGERAAAGGGVAPNGWNGLSKALAAAALATSALAGWVLLRPEPPQSASRHVLSAEGWAAVAGRPFGEYSALAPDGSSMILPLEDRLGLKMRNSTEITPIPGTEGARNVVYSPDAKWIAYAVGTEVFKRPLVGGAPVRLAQGVEPEPFRVAIAWLDDRTMIYEPALNNQPGVSLVQMSEDGGEPIIAVELGVPTFWVHGLPGAHGLLVVSSNRALQVVDLRDGSFERVLEGVLRAWYVDTGHIVYVRDDGALFAVPFDLGGLRLTGNGVPLFEGVRTTPTTADMHLAADGTLLYVEGAAASGGSAVPLWIDRDGTREVLDPSLSGTFGAPAISPDGSMIAFEYAPVDGGTQDIWIYDRGQRTFSRLTFEGDNNRYPFWSADGREVGFSSDRDSIDALYVRPANLSGPTRLLLADADQPLFEGSWTPDGTLLVFRRGTQRISDVGYAAPDADGAATLLLDTPAIERNPSLSPDGNWLAYISDESGRNEVYARPFPGPGGRRQISTGGGRNPVWARSGQEIFYLNEGASSLTAARFRTQPEFAVESRDELFPWVYLSSTLHPEWDINSDDGRILAIGPPPQSTDGVSRVILVQNFLAEIRERTGRN